MTELQRWTDKYVFGFFCVFFGILRWLFFFVKTGNRFDRILIIRLWAVGETILTLPMIHAVRKKYPRAKITVICRSRVKDVFYKNGDVDEILLFEPRNIFALVKNFRRFDVAIDTEPFFKISALLGFFLASRRVGFSHGIRALLYTDKVKFNDEQHEVLTFLDLSKTMGAHYLAENLIKLNYSKEDEKEIDKLLKNNGIMKNELLVGLCPGTAESARFRMWPAERFAKVADKLVEKYEAKIIIIGNKSDAEVASEVVTVMKHRAINLAGKTTLRELFYLIERCKIFISNDTGPMHIAAAQGVKTIGLFGPNLPERFAPFGKGNIAIRQYKGKPVINVHLGQVPKHTNIDFMKSIKVGDVFAAAEKLL